MRWYLNKHEWKWNWCQRAMIECFEFDFLEKISDTNLSNQTKNVELKCHPILNVQGNKMNVNLLKDKIRKSMDLTKTKRKRIQYSFICSTIFTTTTYFCWAEVKIKMIDIRKEAKKPLIMFFSQILSLSSIFNKKKIISFICVFSLLTWKWKSKSQLTKEKYRWLSNENAISFFPKLKGEKKMKILYIRRQKWNRACTGFKWGKWKTGGSICNRFCIINWSPDDKQSLTAQNLGSYLLFFS